MVTMVVQHCSLLMLGVVRESESFGNNDAVKDCVDAFDDPETKVLLSIVYGMLMIGSTPESCNSLQEDIQSTRPPPPPFDSFRSLLEQLQDPRSYQLYAVS
jgi:hypothetical protein